MCHRLPIIKSYLLNPLALALTIFFATTLGIFFSIKASEYSSKIIDTDFNIFFGMSNVDRFSSKHDIVKILKLIEDLHEGESDNSLMLQAVRQYHIMKNPRITKQELDEEYKKFQNLEDYFNNGEIKIEEFDNNQFRILEFVANRYNYAKKEEQYLSFSKYTQYINAIIAFWFTLLQVKPIRKKLEQLLKNS